MVNRRRAIKQAFLLAGGVALVPRYIRGDSGQAIGVGIFEIDEAGQRLLAELVDTLIPRSDTKGAKELGVHLFVFKMLDDCHDEEEQNAFAKGLGQLEAFSRRRFGSSFSSSDETKRLQILAALGDDRGVSGDLRRFFRVAKRRTIQGYLESEYVMTHVAPHKMVPDPYDGFYPASNYRS